MPPCRPQNALSSADRVDVSHRHQIVCVDDLAEVCPGGLDRFEVGHVGHAASGGQVGQVDLDLVAREDVGRFRHEVNAAKDDAAAGLAAGGELAQPEAVAAEVGEPDDLVLLVMVSQDQERFAHRLFDPADPRLQLGIGQLAISLESAGAKRRGEVSDGWCHGRFLGKLKLWGGLAIRNRASRRVWPAEARRIY